MSDLVAVLFARADSNYKLMPQCDVYDFERDALTWQGGAPVVAHPPCRAWGSFRGLAKPRDGERDLAFFAVDQVRRFGGVLEHPVASQLWPVAGLPKPGARDAFGGFTWPILQSAFGHRADKPTLLYVCGCEPGDVPAVPLRLGKATHVIAQMRTRKDGTRIRKGDSTWRPEVSKAEREHTPPQLAAWLVDLAVRCGQAKAVRHV
ncbi:hypothetical protein [Pseudoxanthomonas sp.]|uniref:hypothetical protein n=1 Tax=Pseudoxanthomonas sp. TaxID=1871049 RepID=UPI00262C0004|nr:hypothetical protein [Pseudoxanthomonas sp.]WDS36974.1 MAG: hypothetical protein O8I58_03430 [Pseudoxanthomonas sp.]